MSFAIIFHFIRVRVGNFLKHRCATSHRLISSELQDLLPGIINELGSENLDNLKEIAGSYGGGDATVGDDDDDVPDLVENFEDAAK